MKSIINFTHKKTIILLSLFLLSLNCIAQTNDEKVRVGILNGPSCIPAIKLLDQSSEEYNFEKYADPQALLPKLLKNEIDIGFMPLNVAAKVYNSTNKKIVCLAVSGNGNLSIISKNKKIKKLSELKGNKIFIAGHGATPEYIFKYILDKNRISYTEDSNSSSVILDYSIQTQNLVPSIITNKIEFALLPEPFATIAKLKDKKIKTVIDIQQEFEDVTVQDNVFPLTVIVASKDFITQINDDSNTNKIQKFLKDYEESYKWVISNPTKAGKLFEKYDMGLSAGIVTASIPKANYTFVKGSEAKKSCEELLTIFLENDKSSIGGKLPEQDFYY